MNQAARNTGSAGDPKLCAYQLGFKNIDNKALGYAPIRQGIWFSLQVTLRFILV